MKYALIIGNNQYEEPKLAQLKTPEDDARALARVLRAKSIGNFDEVNQLINQSEVKTRRAISAFLSDRKPDDLVLLYFSGHGILDDRGSLFLALKDTRTNSLNATGISSSFITYEMDNCRSRRQILILDCCNSGAFARGTKGEQKAVTESTFEGNGTGRAVLTASDSTQFAFEGDQVVSQIYLSLFTHFLVEGLKTGEADINGDGKISLDEWYDYTHTKITSLTPRQIPHKWSYNQQGELIIARNPFAKKKREKVSQNLSQPERKLNSSFIDVAVRDFEKLLRSRAPEPQIHENVLRLNEEYQVRLVDWAWEERKYVNLDELIASTKNTWSNSEIERLHNTISLIANAMGGSRKFVHNLGGVTIRKAKFDSHGGEASEHRISLSEKGSHSSWTIVNEFAYVWDANYDWQLSRLLEKYTGGYTSQLLSYMKRLIGLSDSGLLNPENKPGRYGRKPGCNDAGYFFGDKPCGSSWGFNRVEDFAESVAMYIGWERENELSQDSHNRIIRYQLKNGHTDAFNVVDNWQDYAKWFYPEKGDYVKTKRWQFVDDLVNDRIVID
jgi:uncharacterized caspase-like protein